MLDRARRSRRLVVGLTMLAGVGAVAVAASVLGGDPLRPGEAILNPPSSSHIFGTDELGRDVLLRTMEGSRTALTVALASAIVGTALGLTVGLVSGYAGGLLDEVLLKVAEVFQVIPAFFVVLVAGALLGSRLSVVILVLALTFWPASARMARAEAVTLRDREFVEAARAIGARPFRILVRHLLPSALPPVLVIASFQAGVAVLIEGGFAFLGLGDPSVVSWGRMLAGAQSYLRAAWWTALFPGAAMALTMVALNLIGDGLGEVADVRAAGLGPDMFSRGRRRGASRGSQSSTELQG